jgi:hypothetical protein
VKVTAFTRSALAVRRERRDLTKQGYTCHETEWEIIRGHRWQEVILDVRISADRKHVWVKTGAEA